MMGGELRGRGLVDGRGTRGGEQEAEECGSEAYFSGGTCCAVGGLRLESEAAW
jgi:hypothetical protein